MEEMSPADLRGAIEAADVPETWRPSSGGRCGVCGGSVPSQDEVVEVSLSGSGPPEAPEALLCPSCYEHVVREMGIAPLRVFKTDNQRRVVLPVSSGEG